MVDTPFFLPFQKKFLKTTKISLTILHFGKFFLKKICFTIQINIHQHSWWFFLTGETLLFQQPLSKGIEVCHLHLLKWTFRIIYP